MGGWRCGCVEGLGESCLRLALTFAFALETRLKGSTVQLGDGVAVILATTSMSGFYTNMKESYLCILKLKLH